MTTLASPFVAPAIAPPAATLREILALAETGLALQAAGLARALAPLQGTADAGVATLLQRVADRAATCAWALRRFPQIDPAVIKMTKRAKVQFSKFWGIDIAGRPIEIAAPAFAVQELHGETHNSCLVRSGSDVSFSASSPIRLGGVALRWEEIVTPEVTAEIQRALGMDPMRDLTDIRLLAKTPAFPPRPVVDRILPLLPRFDRVDLLFEAEWRGAAETKDPLVIGSLDVSTGHAACFVLAAYDQTQLEAYISREFATGPAA
jgi:hypothetical protein